MLTVNLCMAIALMTFVTYGQKIVPFIALGTFKDNKVIAYLAERLPPAVMLLLVIYALRTQWEGFSSISLIPIFASLFTAIIHILFRHPLMSIMAGVLMFAVLKNFLI